jgi:hypothetical protein
MKGGCLDVDRAIERTLDVNETSRVAHALARVPYGSATELVGDAHLISIPLNSA